MVSLAAVVALVPEGRLSCAALIQERSPDGRWTLSLCPRPMLVAMPGQGSDGPGWIVLRDKAGFIRGVSALDMIQLYDPDGTPPVWEHGRVTIPMTVELALPPARNRLRVWLADRMWRLRASAGFTARSTDFR